MTAAWEEREDHRGTGDLQPAIQREQQDWMSSDITNWLSLLIIAGSKQQQLSPQLYTNKTKYKVLEIPNGVR